MTVDTLPSMHLPFEDSKKWWESKEYADLEVTISRFYAEVWKGRKVQEAIQMSETRGMKGEFGGIEVMMYDIIARTVITFVDTETGHWVTIMTETDADYDRFGLHTYSSNEDAVVRGLINRAIDNWDNVMPDEHVILDAIAALRQS